MICVVDATTLQRGLYLALQLIESGVPVVVALNMMDAAERLGLRIDTERLSQLFGAPVVPIVATKRRGLDALRIALEKQLGPSGGTHALAVSYPLTLEANVDDLVPAVAQWRPTTPPPQLRVFALWCLLSLGDDSLRDVPDAVRKVVDDVRTAAADEGRDLDLDAVEEVNLDPRPAKRLDAALGVAGLLEPRVGHQERPAGAERRRLGAQAREGAVAEDDVDAAQVDGPGVGGGGGR